MLPQKGFTLSSSWKLWWGVHLCVQIWSWSGLGIGLIYLLNIQKIRSVPPSRNLEFKPLENMGTFSLCFSHFLWHCFLGRCWMETMDTYLGPFGFQSIMPAHTVLGNSVDYCFSKVILPTKHLLSVSVSLSQ